MADIIQDLGGRIGVSTLITSATCIASCFAASLVAYKASYTVKISEADQWETIHIVCFAIIALLSAMIVEHTYVIFYVRPVFSRQIPHEVRLDRVFFGISACFWIFFGTGQLCFAMALKNMWHRSASPRLLLGGAYSLIPFLLSMVFLHIKATSIRHDLSIVVRIMRLPLGVVESRADDRCAICLSTPEIGDRLIRLPCLHAFHEKCGVQWLLKNPTCPLCSTLYASCRYEHRRMLKSSSFRRNLVCV